MEHVGRSGEKLLAFADAVATRLRQIGGDDYRPRIHLDVYGTLGELFANDTDKIAAYLATIVETVQPYGFLIESPIIAKTQREQIELFRKLRETLRRNGTDIGVIADEWCNTLEDVKLFTDEQAADFLRSRRPISAASTTRSRRCCIASSTAWAPPWAARPTRPTNRRESAPMSRWPVGRTSCCPSPGSAWTKR